jgi:hypothetical protein
VTTAVDRIAGDRVEVPLLVAAAVQEALRAHGIDSRVMYGPVAWIEIVEDQSPVWAGSWGEFYGFWVATRFGEVVDLNTSVAHRKRAHDQPGMKPIYSPPMLWSAEVPSFYRYQPEGIAEVELHDERDQKMLARVLEQVREHCRPDALRPEDDLDFPPEAILCPGRKILDDPTSSFKHFDRALSIRGIPRAPF